MNPPHSSMSLRGARWGFLASSLGWLTATSITAAIVAGCSTSDEAVPSVTAPAVVSTPRATNQPITTSVEPWLFDGETGRVIRTPWYRVWTTETDPTIVDKLPIFLEQALIRYTRALAPLPSPPVKLDTFLMRTRDQWATLTQDVMGDQASVYLRIDRGGFASSGRALLWSIGPRDTLAIAAHEGWHQYTQRTFRESLPIWLEEGIATYMEGIVPDLASPAGVGFSGWSNLERFDRLRGSSSTGELMSLEELLDATPQQLIQNGDDRTLTYYAQVWAMVHFLREGEGGKYSLGLSNTLIDAAYGQLEAAMARKLGDRVAQASTTMKRGPGVFVTYFNQDLDVASEEYERFVQLLVRDEARDWVARGLSPIPQPH